MAEKYDLSEFYEAPKTPENLPDQNYDLSEFYEPVAPEAEPSLMQKAGFLGALGKGAVSGAVGALPDILTMPYNIAAQTAPGPVYHPGMERSEMEEFAQKTGTPLVREQMPLIPSVTEAVSKGIGKFAGETPEEYKSLEKGAEFVGGLLGPGAIAKGAAKLGQTGAAKALGALGTTKPTELLGAQAAGTVMGELQESGYGLPAQLAGAIGAGAAGTGAAKALKTLTKPPSETIGKVLSLGAKIDPKAIQYEKSLGWQRSWNDKLDSDLAHAGANTFFDTLPTSRKYKNEMKEIKQSHIDTVTREMESISPEKLDKMTSSVNYQAAATKEGQRLEDMSKALYKRADSYRNTGDTGSVEPLIKEMNHIESILSKSPDPSADELFMLNKIKNMKEELGLIPSKEELKLVEGLKAASPEDKKYLLKNISQKRTLTELPLEKLTALKSSWQRSINYDQNIPYGAKRFMNQLIGGADRSIGTTSNKEFLNHQSAANAFFKRSIVENVRSDFARSLKEGETPKLAFDYMSDPRRIAELEKIVGNSPAAKQTMNALKRAKLEQVVVDHIKNKDGSLSYANLAGIFTNKSTQIPMLKSLLGKQGYENFEKMAYLAQKRSAASKVLAGPSKSAQRGHDIALFGTAISAILHGNIPLIATVGAEAGTINLMSRLVSNKKYIDAAVKHAEARAANRLTDAGKYKREMGQVFLKQILPSIRESQKEKAPE